MSKKIKGEVLATYTFSCGHWSLTKTDKGELRYYVASPGRVMENRIMTANEAAEFIMKVPKDCVAEKFHAMMTHKHAYQQILAELL